MARAVSRMTCSRARPAHSARFFTSVARPTRSLSPRTASPCESNPGPRPLAEVALQPHGDQVKHLTLAWEGPNGNWQLIRPAVTGGKVMVPPGNYRLYACSLVGGSASRDQVMVSGMQRIPQTPVSIAAGQANTLDCGGPVADQGHGHQGEGRNVWAAHRGFQQRIGQFGAHVAHQRESRRVRRGDLLRFPTRAIASNPSRPSPLSASFRPGARRLPAATWSLGEVAPARTHGEYPRTWLARKSL